jgi:uncharacterized membrane protein YphA (DoxX/SURF4 family)
LQRLVTAAVLLYSAITHFHATSHSGLFGAQIVEAGAGILLLAGLWTPVVGAIVAVRELWGIFSGGGDSWMAAILAAIGASLAMIGPGAWSIDARLFGRRQIKRLR